MYSRRKYAQCQNLMAGLIVSGASLIMFAGPAMAQAADSGEVIVTAQRRGENIQDVPISVTAASAETLQNLSVRSTADLAVIAPAVTFSTGLGGAAITVRSVGGTGSGSDESANAVYVDGVYMPSPSALLFQFNNIERLEVLKGPQGTLFGRNASGGLVQVITKSPQFTPGGSAELGYGNYDTRRFSTYFTAPISDSMAIDFAAVGEDQGEGWGTNIFSGGQAYAGSYVGVRSKLLWNISPDTTATLSALYSRNRSASIQGSQILVGEFAAGGTVNAGFYNQNTNVQGFVRAIDQNIALTVKHDFGPVSFTSITSRDYLKLHLKNDADYSPIPGAAVDIMGPANSWTQEFQLASAAESNVQWIGGLFYYHNDLITAPFRLIGPNRDTNGDQNTDSYAAYAQATFPLGDQTNLTTGLRYTEDKRRLWISTNPIGGPITVFPEANTTTDKLTWRLALDHHFTDDLMAYASYSRGFKSGLYNSTNAGSPPVEPQTIDAYEAGFKSDLSDTVRLNASAFYYDMQDIQLRGIVPGNPTPIFYNAASATTYGLEAEVAFDVTENFSVNAALSYLKGEYGDDFTNALFFRSNAPGVGLTQLPPGDAGGNETVFTPEWVFNLSGQYRIPTSVGDFKLGASYTYTDSYFFDPQNRVSNPAYSLLNATVAWEATNKVTVRAYVNNALDEQYYVTIQPGTSGDNSFPGAPMTYGMSVGYKF